MPPIDERFKTLGIVRHALYGETRSRAVTELTAPHFTGLVASIDLEAAEGAAARPSGYCDGRR